MSYVTEQLKIFFKEKGISQTDVGIALGGTPQYANQLLNGKKSLGRATAKKLHDAYGLSTAWLLTGEGEMLKPEPQPTQSLNINGNRSSRVTVNNVNSGTLDQSKTVTADVDKAVLLERIKMLEKQLEEEKARSEKLLDKIIKMQ